MADPDLRDRFLNTLTGKAVDKVPALSVTQTGTVELMKESGAAWPEAHFDAEKMAALALSAHTFAGLEAVRYPFCLTVLSEAMGCRINQGRYDIQPSPGSHPFAKEPEKLELPSDFTERGRIPLIFDVTSILRKKVGEEVPLIAGMEGPASLASRLIGTYNFLTWTLKKPEILKECLEVTRAVCSIYTEMLYEAGVDAVCIVDGIAGPDTLDPRHMDALIKPEYERFCRSGKGIKLIHVCGNSTSILKTLSRCGFQGISIEEKVTDLRAAKKLVGGKTSLIGNLSSSGVMLNGTCEEIKEEARRCLEGGIDILAPGCGIAPKTPIKNIRALIEARNEYYR
ncbi:methylcobamide:CoM methyltransferase MtaA [Methanosarcina sp. 1.H.A.2.2]|uniref:methylcobamide:CoM methyltransferase MtaA n=1 Tax=Methanosarcina sp. 1.H.A.2.2 TaxID=1483601 RepID=UPI000620E486|nr:methylcobamide:CoM methyltransferase MtaA [Methanosarcina sp. 1.H.A.2.2]KKH49841.1 methylcobamide:CoM methyltransferase [Methanosarcina sp. 1.H.A.2.2]